MEDDWLEAAYEDRHHVEDTGDFDLDRDDDDDEPEYALAPVHLRSGDGTLCGSADMPAQTTNDESRVRCMTCRSLL
jgi:hypothetical protein